MSEKNEIIRLDARLVDMVPPSAFLGELANGHRLVAYVRSRADLPVVEGVKPGDTVQVEMSPYDMSQGRIVAVKTKVVGNES